MQALALCPEHEAHTCLPSSHSEPYTAANRHSQLEGNGVFRG